MTEEVRADRAEAAEALWRSLHAGLRRGLRARGASDDVIDDVLQDTFLRLHERVDELVQVRHVDRWLWRVAQNALVDRARRDRTRTAEPIDERTAAPSQADPADANWNREVERWLRDYIDELPEPYRDAVRLHEVDGLE